MNHRPQIQNLKTLQEKWYDVILEHNYLSPEIYYFKNPQTSRWAKYILPEDNLQIFQGLLDFNL